MKFNRILGVVGFSLALGGFSALSAEETAPITRQELRKDRRALREARREVRKDRVELHKKRKELKKAQETK